MPYLGQLQESEGIVVQITERIGNLAVAIYSAQRLAEDITKAHYGYHFPLHCGSKGQVLLAYERRRASSTTICAATSSG